MSTSANPPTTETNTQDKLEDPAASTATAPAVLEEDDEFEDFPVEDWPAEEAEVPGGNDHLWEESWDDDDASEDFSKQLKEELEKVKANK